MVVAEIEGKQLASQPTPTGTFLRERNRRRIAWFLACSAILVLVSAASIAVGSKQIPISTVIDELLHRTDSESGEIIWKLRIPRTLIGLSVGAALGLAGAVMQGLTRNPLADPGLLGVDAGAAAAVVVAISFAGLHEPREYVWFALVGAGAATVLVYVLGSRGRSVATPVRLALAGMALSAALNAFVDGVVLLDLRAFDRFRFWSVGSLAGRDLSVLYDVGPFLLVGALCALAMARPLNALTLGDDTGRALGAHLGRTRAMGVITVTLLCGAATAACGPIWFIGLTVPHVARAITGPDQRWVLPFSMVLAPILLLGADVIARVVVLPNEIDVGLVTAAIGAPVFVAIVRRRRIAAL